MAQRTQLDKINDFDFTVRQLIYKGRAREAVSMLLKERGVDHQDAENLIVVAENKFPGIRRFESSRSVRLLNCVADCMVCSFLLIVLVLNETIVRDHTYLIILVPFLYYVLPEMIFGQTLGKFMTQSMVVDVHGNKPRFHFIILRTFCRLIPVDAVYYLSADRTLHDRISGTFVVNKRFLERNDAVNKILHD